MTHEQKVERAKELLGKRYLLHPADRVRRLPPSPDVLRKPVRDWGDAR